MAAITSEGKWKRMSLKPLYRLSSHIFLTKYMKIMIYNELLI